MSTTTNIETERKNSIAFYFLCTGAFFTMVSLATHLPAYPHMLSAFNLEAGSAIWMQLGLALGLTGFQPLFGWIGDTYGQKMILVAGALFLIIGSLLVVFSPFFWVLVFGLFFKGLAGAAVSPIGNSYAGKLFTGEKRGKALGVFAASLTIGALFGPLISGAFVDGLGWISTFWLTAIFGLVALVLFAVGIPTLKKDENEVKRKLDLPGVILVFIALAAILTVPTAINNYGFESGLWVPSLILFIITMIVLTIVENKTKEPLLDVKYAKNKHFWAPSLIALLIGLGYAGIMYLLTFFVQDFQGKSGTLVGMLQMVIFLTTALGSTLAGRYMAKISARLFLALGILIFTTGLVLTSLANINTSNMYMFITMVFLGFGFGLTQPLLPGIIISKVEATRINVVNYTYQVISNVAQRIGASFALVAVALFAAKGDAGGAITKTSLAFALFAILGLLILRFIPKTVEGIHQPKDASESQKEVS